MYLKALEIQGFKSFPDKVILPFEKKITAIVGPNGSGKSNISDAVSWVMGEQRSKALRGSKMEDVIFGGTSQRGPGGFAQVTLILGNEDRSLKTDSDEVSITRRYYRSGESEYYINRKSVRLKDVNELLMDTGLGRDGYSLVGQGRVDEILAASSEDRREVFEEAAGISKFRHKKEETQRKLDRTGENLLRVGDKISELELQVEPLRKQAEAAKRYLLLRDELRGLEISLWMDALDKLTEKSRLIRQSFDEVSETLSKEKAGVEALYEESERCTEGIRQADERAETLREEIARQEKEALSLQNEAAELAAEVQNNLGSLARLDEEQDRQQDRENELRVRLQERQERLSALDLQLQNVVSRQNGLFSDSTAAATAVDAASEKLDELLLKAAAEDAAASAEDARRGALLDSLASLEERRRELSVDLAQRKERLTAEEAALAQIRGKLGDQQEAEAAARNAYHGHELIRKARRQKLDALDEELRTAKLEESAARARFSLLSDMEREYEGFSRAVRVVMRERSRGTLKHIRGTVAELIRTDDRYTVAVETALGNSLQSIIVDAEEDGKVAIEYLKRTDAGRATFLPMSTMHGSELNQPGLLQMHGVEGLASQLVECEPDYRSIILYQLGRTVVARDLDAAIAVSRRYGGRIRLVTLDGQLINPGGSMTGGSSARNVGALSRANEMERLRVRLSELDELLSELREKQNAAAKELANSAFSADAAASELRSAEDACLRIRGELGQQEALTAALRESTAEAERTCTGIDGEKAQLSEAEKTAAEAAEAHRRASAELKDRAAGDTRSRQALEERLRAINEATARLREEEASLRAEQISLQQVIGEWEKLLADYKEDRENREAAKKVLKEKNEALQTQEEALRTQAGAISSAAEAKRPELDEAMRLRQDYEGRRNRAEKSAQDANRHVGELERQFASLEQQKNSADMEEKQLLDKLWDSYELSRGAAQKERRKLESLTQAQKRASQLRREMSAMGSPNLGAIEEFERVNERYTFLTDQRDDIEKARNELLEIIAKLTVEMEAIFRTEFEAVARSFAETFTELFGGGRGELVLEDPNDILNCGIEIRVQPPGKSLRTLTLLSGGERAFVAIALYFAMLKVRPAPFCVLDEIESALDENNVIRFAQYTRSMSERTQFLIITHRRGTMENADELYGVTMQKGISRVLSVELDDALKTGTV